MQRVLFTPPKRTYTLDMFRRKHLIWIPQEGKSSLPCLFVAPKQQASRNISRRKSFVLEDIDDLPPIPDLIEKTLSQLEKGEYLVIYVKSNSMDLASSYEFVKRMSKTLGVYVLCFEFSGYGFALNKGQQNTPTEVSTKRDFRNTYNFVRKTLSFPSERIIIFGESIGCGIACYGAHYAEVEKKEKIGALCLRSAYSSVEEILSKSFFINNFTSFIVPKFNNVKLLQNVKCPLLVTHGELDNYLPIELGKKLFDAYKGHFLRKFHTAVGENHDLVEYTSVFLPIAKFIADIKKSNKVLEKILPIPPRIRLPESVRIVPIEFMRATMPEPLSKSIREFTAQGLNTVESLVAGKSLTPENECIKLTTNEEVKEYLEVRLTKFCRALAANYYAYLNTQNEKASKVSSLNTSDNTTTSNDILKKQYSNSTESKNTQKLNTSVQSTNTNGTNNRIRSNTDSSLPNYLSKEKKQELEDINITSSSDAIILDNLYDNIEKDENSNSGSVVIHSSSTENTSENENGTKKKIKKRELKLSKPKSYRSVSSGSSTMDLTPEHKSSTPLKQQDSSSTSKSSSFKDLQTKITSKKKSNPDEKVKDHNKNESDKEKTKFPLFQSKKDKKGTESSQIIPNFTFKRTHRRARSRGNEIDLNYHDSPTFTAHSTVTDPTKPSKKENDEKITKFLLEKEPNPSQPPKKTHRRAQSHSSSRSTSIFTNPKNLVSKSLRSSQDIEKPKEETLNFEQKSIKQQKNKTNTQTENEKRSLKTSVSDFISKSSTKEEKKKENIKIEKVTAQPNLQGNILRPMIRPNVTHSLSSSFDCIAKKEKKTKILSRKQIKKWIEGQYYFYAPLLDVYMEIEQLHVTVGPGTVVPHFLGASFKAIGSAPFGLLHAQIRIGGLLYCWDRKSKAAPREMYFKHVYNVKKTRCRIPIFLTSVPKNFFVLLTKWLQNLNVLLPFNEYLENVEKNLTDLVNNLLNEVLPIYTESSSSLGVDNTTFCEKMKFWGKIVLKWDRDYYYHAVVANCQDFFLLNCAAFQFTIPGDTNIDVKRAAINLFPNERQESLFKASPYSAEMNSHVNTVYKGKRVMGPKYNTVEEFISIHNDINYTWDSPDYSVMSAQWYLQTCPIYSNELCSILVKACKKFRKVVKEKSRNIK